MSTWIRRALVGAVALGCVACTTPSPVGSARRLAGGHERVGLKVDGTPDAEVVYEDRVSTLAFSPDGAYLATGGPDRTVRVWDLARGEVVQTIEHPDPVRQVAWSAAGAIATRCTRKQTVFVWDPLTGERAGKAPPGLEGAPRAFAFDASGEHLVIVTFRGELFWSRVDDGSERGFVELGAGGFPAASARVAFVPGSPTTVVCALRTLTNPVFVVDLAQPPEKPEPLFDLGDGNTVTGLVVSPKGDAGYLATGQGLCLKFELPSGKELWRTTVPQTWALALSPDGSRLALGHDNSDRSSWLDAETGKLVGALPVLHGGEVLALGFSPDGKRLASAGRDTVPLVHDLLD